jgi:hypothetical protein
MSDISSLIAAVCSTIITTGACVGASMSGISRLIAAVRSASLSNDELSGREA